MISIPKCEYLRRLDVLADLLESGVSWSSDTVSCYIPHVIMAKTLSEFRTGLYKFSNPILYKQALTNPWPR